MLRMLGDPWTIGCLYKLKDISIFVCHLRCRILICLYIDDANLTFSSFMECIIKKSYGGEYCEPLSN